MISFDKSLLPFLLFGTLVVVSVEGLQLLPLRHKLQKRLERHHRQEVSTTIPEPTFEIISVDVNSLSDEDAQRKIDEHLMGMALQQAKEAGDKFGELPIGAIIAEVEDEVNTNFDEENDDDDENKGEEEGNGYHAPTVRRIRILSSGQNQIETNQDASAHAEMQALRSAGTISQNWRLLNATLYSTLEPCPMCLSAAQAFRVSRIVYGAPDLRLGAAGTYVNLLEQKHPFHDTMEVVGGVREEEARTLLVDFFRARRKKGKKKKKQAMEQVPEENDQENDDEKKSVRTRGRIRGIIRKFVQ